MLVVSDDNIPWNTANREPSQAKYHKHAAYLFGEPCALYVDTYDKKMQRYLEAAGEGGCRST